MPDIEDLKLLLPFYVNGTLGAQDCARVDHGLAVSAELRKELDDLNAFAQIIREGGQAMNHEQSDVDAQLNRVMNDPRMAQAEQPQLKQNPAQDEGQAQQSTKGFLAFLNPKNWHPAISLSLAVAALAQAALLTGLSGERKENGQQIAKLEKRVGDLEYQLASGPGGGSAQPDILVQVKPTASWAALSDVLATEGLTIVDGPSDNTLSLSSELDGEALDAVITRLLASGLIETADKAK